MTDLDSYSLIRIERMAKFRDILQMEDTEETANIVKDLQIHGRQALITHKDMIIEEVYNAAMSPNSELLNLIKEGVCVLWSSLYCNALPWLYGFIEYYKNELPNLFDTVVTRSAEYGSRFNKHSQPLSIVIQFIFELSDELMLNSRLFDDIWGRLTTSGLASLSQFSDHLVEEIMNDLMTMKNEVLFLALREYFREPLFSVLKQCNVSDRQDLYQFTLNSVAERGWVAGFEVLQKKFAPRVFKELQLHIQKFSLEPTVKELPPSLNAVEQASASASTTIQKTEISSTANIKTNMSSFDARDEINIIKACVLENYQLENLVEAGELCYIDQTLSAIIENIVQRYQQHRSFSVFIRDCVTPIMYLLKRQQNLDYFIRLLLAKYRRISQVQIHQSSSSPISLRMIVDVLFLNSNVELRRTLISLLSKRNPVPFLQPTILEAGDHRFIPEIIHVWNHVRPTLLSFGVGSCRGKSFLLNLLFQSSFEERVDSIYFMPAVDVDFGLSFIPPRPVNIADTHGLMTTALLCQLRPIFDGFLMHVDELFFRENSQTVLDFVSLLPADKPRMVIVRDAIASRSSQYLSVLSPFENLRTFVLPKITNASDRESEFLLDDLREAIRESMSSNICGTNGREHTKMAIQNLLAPDYVDYMDKTTAIIRPLKIKLIGQASSSGDKSFPLYTQFVSVCQKRKNMSQVDIYGSDEKLAELYKVTSELRASGLNNTKRDCGAVFNLFVELLSTRNKLMSLDLLSSQLKQERLALGASKLAGNLSIQDTFLSLEVLWRNAIVCFDHTSSVETQQLLISAYRDFIKAGNPFEIVDGDNFHMQRDFLKRVLDGFSQQRILVLSIIGPQNSGKSTLLNYMFGTLFDVREGRCTRGIYGSFVKSRSPEFDYILLIDTEGLLSVEKGDKEYDRRLVLFCLAVSHLVIVNMLGDVNETLKDMLALCADSLKRLEVDKVPCPIVHFVLNQKADLDINNHAAAIEKIVSDLKEKDLAETISITKDTFHALPSAFKKGRSSLDNKQPRLVRTEPDFIEHTQNLCGKILQSAKMSLDRSEDMITCPSRWLEMARVTFEILQKFPDLTYFRDISERHQNDEIRSYIQERLTTILSAAHREELLGASAKLNEWEIEQLFQARFQSHQEDFETELIEYLKNMKVSERIRDRNKQFLQRQITEICNAWRNEAIKESEKRKMEVLVRDGAEEVRSNINEIIKHEHTMTKDQATNCFNNIWKKKMKQIKSEFDPIQRFQAGIKLIYGNYGIYEKQNLPSLNHISLGQPIATFYQLLITQAEVQSNTRRVFYQELTDCGQSCVEHQQLSKNAAFTTDAIQNFKRLNVESVLQHYVSIMDETNSKHMLGGVVTVVRGLVKDVKHMFSRSTSQNYPKAKPLVYKTLIQLRDRITAEIMRDPLNAANVLHLPTIYKSITDETIGLISGDGTGYRTIDMELIQKINDSVNTTLTEASFELQVFHLALSKQAKSLIHTFVVLLLAYYHYLEQKRHFDQQLQTMIETRESQLSYFISMIVPDAGADVDTANNLIKHVMSNIDLHLRASAKKIIGDILNSQRDFINRRSIQHLCDSRLTSADENWVWDYIEDPTKVIEREFNTIWSGIQKSIDQQLGLQKVKVTQILDEFFGRVSYIQETIKSYCTNPKQYIDGMFESENGQADKNIQNKGYCVVLLLFDYFSGKPIQSTYTLFETMRYSLKKEHLDKFESLPVVSKELADVISYHLDKNQNKGWAQLGSIKNIFSFLENILNKAETTKAHFKKLTVDFANYDDNQTYMTLLERARGCNAKCPCCRRPCDADHSKVKSQPGTEDNQHSCETGHQLRAMSGVKFEVSEEASLQMCEQINNENVIVLRGGRWRWEEIKAQHRDWNFDKTVVTDLDAIRGKFLLVWQRIGPRLCKEYGMKLILSQQPQSPPKAYHFILMLDSSVSMIGEPWDNLMAGVDHFMHIRRTARTLDLVSIVVFDSTAHCTCQNTPIDTCDLLNIELSSGGTNFGSAFQLANQIIETTKSNKSKALRDLEFVVIFMTDGEGDYPAEEVESLCKQTSIKQFWTVALGTNNDVLTQINEKLNGVFKQLDDPTDLVDVYAEIASSYMGN